MNEGQYGRVTFSVTDPFIREVRRAHGATGQRILLLELEARLDRLGWKDAVVMQDPATHNVFTTTARHAARTFSGDDVVKIRSVVPIETPHASAEIEPVLSLDPGLQPEELRTLQQALATEENPRHLAGIASTFEPSFPVAGSLLRAKGILLDGQRISQRLTAEEVVQKAGRDPALRPRIVRHALADDLIAASEGLEVDSMWRSLAKSVSPLYVKDLIARPSNAELQAHASTLWQYAAKTKAPIMLAHDLVKNEAALQIAEPESSRANIAPEILNAARALVRHIGPRVRIVDIRALLAICPPTGREGYVSPSALQLALAQMKPEWSKVQDPKETARLCRTLAQSSPKQTDALQARAEIFRARKALERQRWIEWYRRIRSNYPLGSGQSGPTQAWSSGAARVGSFKPSRLTPRSARPPVR